MSFTERPTHGVKQLRPTHVSATGTPGRVREYYDEHPISEARVLAAVAGQGVTGPVTANMREAHEVASNNNDSATTSLLETFIDETEKRTWFLFEATR